MKQIPNIFTLLNLFFGCLAIVYILQNGLVPVTDNTGEQFIVLPENIYWASLCIGIAAVIDFFDGFVARLLNAASAIGKQLDSLADVVSFGVAPAMIVYQFLRLAFAGEVNGLDVSAIWLFPAFIIPCAGAYRLARFNTNNTQTGRFQGVPIPATGLLIASFPLIYWFGTDDWVSALMLNKWFWYAIILCVSYLMVSTLPMLTIKFNTRNGKWNMPVFILFVTAPTAAIFLHWLAVPIIFVLYVVISLATRDPEKAAYANEEGLINKP